MMLSWLLPFSNNHARHETDAKHQDNHSTDDSNNVRFIVTGFGPFAKVESNPTTVLIQRLEEHLRNHYPHLRHCTSTAIVETSAQGVRESMDEIWKTIPRHNSNVQQQQHVIFLHLGVNAINGTGFQLEQCAYNDASFRVPDQRGYQPKRSPIIVTDNTDNDDGLDVGSCLETTIDVPTLVSNLQDPVHYKVFASTNPGRFVCNYMYCYSLYKSKEYRLKTRTSYLPCCPDGQQGCLSWPCFTESNKIRQEDEQTSAFLSPRAGSVDDSCKIQSLFLHVPAFQVVSEDLQLDFVVKLMECVKIQVVVNNNEIIETK